MSSSRSFEPTRMKRWIDAADKVFEREARGISPGRQNERLPSLVAALADRGVRAST